MRQGPGRAGNGAGSRRPLSLSRTTIGPAHSGQRQRCSEHGRPRPLARRAVSVPSRASASTRQENGHAAVGEEAKVSDAHEPFGEQVPEEPAQEFIERKGQQPRFVLVSGVAPTESNLSSANEIRRWLEMATRCV